MYARAIEAPEVQRVLRAAASRSVLFFFRAFLWTIDPRRLTGIGARSPFIPWPFQSKAILALDRALRTGSDILFEKSRDMGATWLILGWMLWRCLFFRDQRFLCVSRIEDLVDGDEDSLFAHLRYMLASLPPWLRRGIIVRKLKILFPRTGSSIEGAATTDNIARGGRRTAILVDEAAKMPNNGELVDSSTQHATRTRIWNSTPWGPNNVFARKAQARKIPVLTFHWSEHPDKRRGLYKPTPRGIEILDPAGVPPGYVFSHDVPKGRFGLRSPWYDREVEERSSSPIRIAEELEIDYSGSVRLIVGAEWVTRQVARFTRPPLLTGNITFRNGQPEQWDFRPTQHGEPPGLVRLWLPLDDQMRPQGFKRFKLFCDISEGTGSSDSVCSIGDVFSRQKVAEFVTNRHRIHTFAEHVLALCWMFADPDGRPPELGWEGNGPGRSFKKVVVDDFQYPRVYYQHDEKQRALTPGKIPGWFSSRETKTKLLRDYVQELERCATAQDPDKHEGFLNPCAESWAELARYREEGEAWVHPDAIAGDGQSEHGQNHGDRVIADAGLSMLLGPAHRLEHPLETKPQGMCLATRRDMAAEKSRRRR